MSADLRIDEFSETLKTITTPEQVWESLKDFSADFGINGLAYYHSPPPGSLDFSEKYFITLGYDAVLTSQHQRDIEMFGNPITSHSNSITEPILWSELFEKLNYKDKQERYLKEFFCETPSEGLFIPVYGPGGRNGYALLRFAKLDLKLGRLSACYLSIVAYLSHIQFSKLRVTLSQNSVHLTAREQEVLKWVARGKSNTVIAEIVGISQHTVNGYLRRIYLKTRTSDRTSAALRAVADSLIEY